MPESPDILSFIKYHPRRRQVARRLVPPSRTNASPDVARVVINPVVYAEISTRFTRIEELKDALPASILDREAIPFEAAFLAAKAFTRYRKRGGARTSTLPDFFVGAHAAVDGHRLLTRDRSRYRSYFPTIEIIAP